jgi:hypothetical protein
MGVRVHRAEAGWSALLGKRTIAGLSRRWMIGFQQGSQR